MVSSSVTRLRVFREFFACFVLGRADLYRGRRIDAASQLEYQVAAAKTRFARAALLLWLCHGKVLLSALYKLMGDYSSFSGLSQELLLFYDVYVIIDTSV